MTDGSGVIRSWNGAAEELYGWTALEALDQEIHVLLPSRRTAMELAVTHYTSRRTDAHGTFVVEDKYGDTRYVESRTHPVRGDSGHVVGTVGVSWDITDRVRATQRLADSESHYRSNFSASKVPQLSLSIDRRIEAVNPAMCGLVGYDEADLVGCSVLCFLHPADMQAFLVDLDAIWSGLEDLGSTVYRCVHSDGHTLWLQVMPSVVRNADGERHSVSAIVLDVTEQRRAQEHYGVVMGTMAEGLFAVDDEGMITFINRAAARMLGWSEEELRGPRLPPDVPLPAPGRVDLSPLGMPSFRVSAERRTVRVTDEVFWRRDGTMLPVAVSAAPIKRRRREPGRRRGLPGSYTRAATKPIGPSGRSTSSAGWAGSATRSTAIGWCSTRSGSLRAAVGRTPRSSPPHARSEWRDDRARRLPAGGRELWAHRRNRSLGAPPRRAASSRMVVGSRSTCRRVTVGDPGMVEFIRRELEAAGADPANLVLELTETALMSNEDAGEEFARSVTAWAVGWRWTTSGRVSEASPTSSGSRCPT